MSGVSEPELNGTDAKLVRKVARGKKITVTFNINNRQKVEEPELTSTPHFVVEVIKNDGKKVLMRLDKRRLSDIFSIRESTSEFECKDTNYTLKTDSLDWALYDHLMDFLADQGVDNTFADELVELSTAPEHQAYITFLEDLKSFVKSQ
ncbi:hypothetical protein H8957_009875 [Semnopithecus entellus]